MPDARCLSAHIAVKASDSDDVLREAAKRGVNEALRQVAEASAQYVWDQAAPHERDANTTTRAEFIYKTGQDAMRSAPQEERDAMEEYLFLILKRRRATAMSVS